MNSSIAYSIPSSTTSTTANGFWPWIHFSSFYSPIGTNIVIPEDKPLDLSAKSSTSSSSFYHLQQHLPLQIPQSLTPQSPLPQQQIRSSVIHSTKDAALYLPTCIQPEISIETPQSPPPPSSSSLSLSSTSAKPSPESLTSSPPNRMSYPREFKLMVIDYYYTNGLNKYRTCKEFQITKSMLNGWLAKADKIKQSKPGALKSGRSGRKPQFPDVEKQLYQMYLERMSQGEKMSNRWIRESAKTLASGQNSTKDLNGMCQFSERWLSNFKRRFGIGGNNCSEVGRILQSDNSTTASGDEGCFHREDDEASCSSEELPSETSRNSAMMAQAVLHQSAGEAPIQAFYKKFPWLCRRSSISHESPSSDATDLREEKPPHSNNRGRKVQFPLIEKQLFEIVVERQKTNPTEKISNKWLQEKAREIAKKSAYHERDELKSAVFSEHWLNNFKKRFNLVQFHHPLHNSEVTDESQKMEE
uniref:HTH CENPB-type domain-containing protein n=1 Tax=Panagrolaimus superbus TaxID=310955 RepID=A0A914XZV0_9BILA